MILPFPADDSTPSTIPGRESKRCTLCEEFKPLSEFLPRTDRPCGYSSRCRPCLYASNVANRARRKAADPEKARAKAKEYYRKYKKPPADIEAHRAANREAKRRQRARKGYDPQEARERREKERTAYRFDIGFRIKKLRRVSEYRARNPDKVRESSRRYYAGHKEICLACNHTHRARKRGNGGRHTAAEWAELKAKYGHKCLKCKRGAPWVKLTRDHIIPLARGGRNDISNLQLLCFGCNLRKGLRIIDYRPKVAAPPPGMLGFMA